MFSNCSTPTEIICLKRCAKLYPFCNAATGMASDLRLTHHTLTPDITHYYSRKITILSATVFFSFSFKNSLFFWDTEYSFMPKQQYSHLKVVLTLYRFTIFTISLLHLSKSDIKRSDRYFNKNTPQWTVHFKFTHCLCHYNPISQVI